ncbi:hypothetical protein OKA04_12305 [Luteolibacter flavescens]|uniref:Holin n=1 Tax=Luteolibacter flavescens TaxID=1859460 RepID=A0ABT3FPM7_9BACT|nr:hypothetical protein [Luteolibacter flavescens]MCW1885513.1 hypothetical protein [Luteolibacter flavescens]
MNKDQALGIVREVGTAIGAALVTYGVTTSSTVELVSGVIIALVSLVFALKANEGLDVVLSLIRKVLSGASGVLVAYGIIDPAKAEALSGVALVLISTSWTISAKSNGTSGAGTTPLWIFALLALFLTPSCTGVYAGITGQPIPSEPVKTADGKSFNVASADVLRAKSSPADAVWGLYNAGLVAQRAAQVIDAGK